MCEGVEFCPGTGKPISEAPCRVATIFEPPTEEVFKGVWGEMYKVLELEDAAREGKTGYQMFGM